jgi:uncharacterized DUF497 family protein
MNNPKKLATYGTQSRRRRKTKQKHNTICVGHHYAQTNTHDVNSLLFMVFNTTFNNISVISMRSVLLVEETRVLEEYHRPVASK